MVVRRTGMIPRSAGQRQLFGGVLQHERAQDLDGFGS